MKFFLRLFAVWLVPLLSVSGLALSRQGDFYGTHGFERDVYSDEPAYPADYPFYGAPSRSFVPSYNEYIPREQRAWTCDFDQRDPYAAPNPAQEQSPRRGYTSSSLVGRGRGSHWGGANRQDMGGGWGNVYPSEGISRNGYAPAPVRGFGFRGDVTPEVGHWWEPRRRPGYRFRPLSEQELGRMTAGAGWRPQAPRPAFDQPRYIDPVPPKETYGYQPNGWLRSYDDVGR